MNDKILAAIILPLLTISIGLFVFCVVKANIDSNAILNKELSTKSIEAFDDVNDPIKYFDGWVNVEVMNIYDEPAGDAKVVAGLAFNEHFEYSVYDKNWHKVTFNDIDGYIKTEQVHDEKITYDSYDQYYLNEIIGFEIYDVPDTSGFKSFMDYRTITSTGSKQYELQNQYASTGDYGIRVVDDRYCVAVGSRFSMEIGQYFDLILENGEVIPCVMADLKSDVHTESNRVVTAHNGCASEFVVDANSLGYDVRLHGDISRCSVGWDSPVKVVKIYNKNIFDLK